MFKFGILFKWNLDSNSERGNGWGFGIGRAPTTTLYYAASDPLSFFEGGELQNLTSIKWYFWKAIWRASIVIYEKSIKKNTTVCNNKARVMFVSPCSMYISSEVREVCGAVLIRASHARVKDRTTPVISRFLSLHWNKRQGNICSSVKLSKYAECWEFQGPTN
jgi:hypothetical protein